MRNHFFLFLGVLGIKILFLEVPWGFEKAIFSWFCVCERKKGCKILKRRPNWIIRSVIEPASGRACSIDYLFNFITEGSNIPKFFLTEKLVNFTVNKHDFAPWGPWRKIDEDGEFWGDHILIPGVWGAKIREDTRGMRSSLKSLGVAWSVVYVRLTDIDISFSNNFSLFKPQTMLAIPGFHLENNSQTKLYIKKIAISNHFVSL